MDEFNEMQLFVAVTVMIVAALLMADGRILGEASTSLGRILLIVAMPIVVKSRKSRIVTDAQRETLKEGQ
ncbi:MAG: hypothetical protein JSW61_03450 [Candidatus Thorarchaeota archaeon]|nr:MAG: hypothetical protein JSW61_03450 [Candidatus Thorarchaeota archaeon]